MRLLTENRSCLKRLVWEVPQKTSQPAVIASIAGRRVTTVNDFNPGWAALLETALFAYLPGQTAIDDGLADLNVQGERAYCLP